MCRQSAGALLDRSIFGDQSIRRIDRDHAGRLVVHLEDSGEPIIAARLRKCFPWSVPEGYLSVRDADGKEVVLLKTLDRLDPQSRQVIRDELERTRTNPRIEEILSIRVELGTATISARTDRGSADFRVRSRDDVRLLGQGRVLFRDTQGTTYELPDIHQLDDDARRSLQPYL